MTSSFTTRNRFNKQAAGDNTNTWGDVLNAGVFDMMDLALDGWVYLTPSANVLLTTVNGAADQARCRGIKFLAGSAAVTTTIPPTEKLYCVWNVSTADQIIASSGGGTSVTVKAGEMIWVACDSVNVGRSTLLVDSGPLNMSGNKITGLANGSAAQDAVTFSQMNTAISSAAFSMGTFGVPIAPGDNGKWLTNNGSTPSWAAMTVAAITDYAADQATRQASILAQAQAVAIAFGAAL